MSDETGTLSPRPARRRWGRFFYILFLVVFTITCAEIAARWYLGHVLGKSSEKKFRFNSYRVFEHVPGFHEGDGKRDWIHIDANGFRRDEDVPLKKPEGTYRVFLMGGSAAHGISSAAPYPIVHIYQDETIDAYLQKMLRAEHPGKKIEVINAAVTGYQVFQHTIYLQSELLEYDPDLVIFFDGANDHYSDNPDMNYMGDFRYQFWKRRLQQPTFGAVMDHMADWLAEYSGIFRGYMAWKLQKDAGTKWGELRLDWTNAAEVIARHKQVAPKQFLRSIETNLFLLQRQGIKAIVCLQPELTLRDTTLLTPAEKGFLRVDSSMIALYPVVLDELNTIGRKFNVPIIDMVKPFNDPTYRDKQLLIDYCHLTPLGGEVVARRLLSVVDSLMQPPPPVVQDSVTTTTPAGSRP